MQPNLVGLLHVQLPKLLQGFQENLLAFMNSRKVKMELTKVIWSNQLYNGKPYCRFSMMTRALKDICLFQLLQFCLF